jgi:D-alanyl-D-alanine dipeptidase
MANNACYPYRRSPSKRPGTMTAAIVGALAAASVATGVAQEGPALPASFVYLRDVDPTIIQDIRYATDNNFTGRRVTGYDAPECLLQKSTATALAKVQSDLKTQGMSLKVYDCYRPQRAVGAFVAWTKAASESKAKKRFHPRLSRSQLLAQGYIAARSGHSRGIVVDATLVRLPPPDVAAFDPTKQYEDCAAEKDKRGPDTSIDFGTGFDCFDSRSNTAAESLTNEQRNARTTMVSAMAKRGFANYRREWWHFTFGVDDARGGSFDVPIRSHAGRAGN